MPSPENSALFDGRGERSRGGDEGMLRMYVGLQTWIARARDREEGQALVEYALILALIAVFCIGALELLGTNVEAQLTAIANAISGA
jgi:pilus assembly protein Flp/PilA